MLVKSKLKLFVLFGLLLLCLMILHWGSLQLRHTDAVIPLTGLDNDNIGTLERLHFWDPALPSPLDVVSHQVDVERRHGSDESKKTITLGFETKNTTHTTQPLCSVNGRVDDDIMKCGRLNQTYMKEKMSVPVVGQCVCRDVICSNFLTDKDWEQWNSCIGKGKSKLHNVIPKCRFQDGTSRPYVALKSFPGSGNTWVRQLLEESTGICTGIHLVTVRLLCQERIIKRGGGRACNFRRFWTG